ncbi:MAG: c-type cytochrome [Rhodobacter sp.]|nr:c-type cytochrome [Rhodobacter sp.]
MKILRFPKPTIWPAVLLTAVSAFHANAAHELEGRDIAGGEALYAEQCAACHGAKLEGQPDWRTAGEDGVLPAPPHDETGHTWHHDNKLLFDYTKLGGEGALEARGITGFKSGMPAFDGVIADEEIWNILAFIRSTWPDRVKEIQAARNSPHH